MKYDSIGANMRMFRMEKNLRQEDIAEHAGLSANYIGMIERGERYRHLKSLLLYAMRFTFRLIRYWLMF